MKKSLFILIFSIVSLAASAQMENSYVSSEMDSVQMTETMKDAIIDYTFYVAFHQVDSIIGEGMYMSALEAIDSLFVIWNRHMERPFPINMYISKCMVLMRLEEWNDLIAVTKECISVYNNETEPYTSVLYSMQGSAYRNVKDYKNAVRAYEMAMSNYKYKNDIGGEADMLCNMAYCYECIEKYSLAGSFYNKGFNKYLEYFNVSRSYLLKKTLSYSDTLKNTSLGVFSCHLYNMAVYEQDFGDRSLSKEYLLMSANCGNRDAQREYDRIYGN